MDKGDYVLVLSFLGFLGFLAFLALSNKPQAGYVVAPNYVQAPSLIQKPESLGG